MSRESLKLRPRYKIAWMLLVGLLSSSSACKTGPKVDHWIVSEGGLASANAFLSYPLAQDFHCLSPSDERRALIACQDRRPFSVNWCVIAKGQILYKDHAVIAGCGDGVLMDVEKEMINWVCLDQGDLTELLQFCKRRTLGL